MTNTNSTDFNDIIENINKLDASVSIYRNPNREGGDQDTRWICAISINNSNGEISTKAERPTFLEALEAAYKNLGIAAVVAEG